MSWLDQRRVAAKSRQHTRTECSSEDAQRAIANLAVVAHLFGPRWVNRNLSYGAIACDVGGRPLSTIHTMCRDVAASLLRTWLLDMLGRCSGPRLSQDLGGVRGLCVAHASHSDGPPCAPQNTSAGKARGGEAPCLGIALRCRLRAAWLVAIRAVTSCKTASSSTSPLRPC